MNGINIPTGQEILAQNGITSLQDFMQGPDSSLKEVISLARKKLEQQRRLKDVLDLIIKEVLNSQ